MFIKRHKSVIKYGKLLRGFPLVYYKTILVLLSYEIDTFKALLQYQRDYHYYYKVQRI